mmetsp:Transcript_959/g.1500  ORF Transcript_959/g.1500 Transcript_959/m.1500 type:complete len:203 (+) Transcript_959:961-1569(+)
MQRARHQVWRDGGHQRQSPSFPITTQTPHRVTGPSLWRTLPWATHTSSPTLVSLACSGTTSRMMMASSRACLHCAKNTGSIRAATWRFCVPRMTCTWAESTTSWCSSWDPGTKWGSTRLRRLKAGHSPCLERTMQSGRRLKFPRPFDQAWPWAYYVCSYLVDPKSSPTRSPAAAVGAGLVSEGLSDPRSNRTRGRKESWAEM